MQQVVGTEEIIQNNTSPVGGLGRHRDSRVADVRWREEKVLGDNVVLLACQQEVHLLVFLVEEGDILIAILIRKVFDDSL